MPEYEERLKFYSNTPHGEINKYFCFNCKVTKIKEFLFLRLSQGYIIRAAYYEKIRVSDQVVCANRKINMKFIYNCYYDYVCNNKPFTSIDLFINLNLFNTQE
jgi:hypothetical protein